MIKADDSDEKNQAALAAYWARFPSERFFAGFTVCAACEALGKAQRIQAEKDKKIIDAGGTVVHESRLWTVYSNPNI